MDIKLNKIINLSKEQVSSVLPVALEGSARAGKTTILEAFYQRQGIIIKEYNRYLYDLGKLLPEFPPSSKESAKQNALLFMNLEFQRNIDLKKNLSAGKALLDRSIFSQIAFEYASSKYTEFNIADWLEDFIIKNAKKVVLPKHIIFLDVSAKTARERNEKATHKIKNFLLEDKFNQGYNGFFYILKKNYPDFITLIDVDKNKEQMTNSTLNIIGMIND
ncbi:MAG TPA: hypothetical protein VJC17_02650 [Candidatus Dojkabacteria bacterium]|nr:hypothetical protein [Candidatus Dojkabacteria bacterium]